MLRPKILFLGVMIFVNLFCVSRSNKPLRDPFNLPSKSVTKKRGPTIKLLGIIFCKNKFGAVVESGGATETVFPKDVFMGFNVLSIKSDRIILSKGKVKKELFIE